MLAKVIFKFNLEFFCTKFKSYMLKKYLVHGNFKPVKISINVKILYISIEHLY